MTETEKEVGTEGERGGSLTRLLTGMVTVVTQKTRSTRLRVPCTMHISYVFTVTLQVSYEECSGVKLQVSAPRQETLHGFFCNVMHDGKNYR